MLHLNTSKRLSIDIDVICPLGTVIENYLNLYAQEYGFGKVELVERISRTDVPKQHAKFYYEVSYPSNGGQDKIAFRGNALFPDCISANTESVAYNRGASRHG